MSEPTTYSTASNARRMARKQGLADFAICALPDGRFAISTAGAVIEAATAKVARAKAKAAAANPAVTPAQAGILAAEADTAEDIEAEVTNAGTIEDMIEAAQAVQAEAVEAEVKGLAQTAAEVRAQTLALIREEDANVDPAKAWTLTFRFEAPNADKAEDMIAVYAKKLGFNVIAAGPQGREIFGLASGRKTVKARAEGKAVKPATEAGAPKGKAAAMMAAATTLGVMPDAPDFSAATHKSYRPKLAKLVELAAKGDIAGLLAVEINPCSTSPKAMDRYRNAAVAALRFAADKAKAA
jgi:hypothetical protein